MTEEQLKYLREAKDLLELAAEALRKANGLNTVSSLTLTIEEFLADTKAKPEEDEFFS